MNDRQPDWPSVPVGGPGAPSQPGGYRLQGDAGYAPRRVRRGGPRWGRVIGVLLVALLVGGGAFAVVGWNYANHLLKGNQTDVRGLQAVAAGQPQNFLVVGSDDDQGLTKAERKVLFGTGVRDAGRRTDTMMVMHLSPKQHKAVMVSIPRDLKTDVPGHGTQKINAAYAFGGPNLLIQTVEQTTGLKINHYVEVNFAGFIGVVDAVGRVQLCNPTNQRWNDVDGSGKRWTSLNLAPHQCENADGTAALAFVRARHFGTGDFGRIQRQQIFMRAVMKKIASGGNLINPPRLLHIANAVSKSVSTDKSFGAGDALSLARRLKTLSPENVDMRSLPSVPLPRTCRTCPDYLGATPEAALLLNAIANDATTLPPVGIPGGKTVSLASVRVAVLNGSGVQGAARKAAAGLQSLGVQVTRTTNAPAPVATTTLAYPARLEAQAKLLGQLLGPQARLVPSSGGNGNELVLTIGKGFKPVGNTSAG